MSKSLLKELKKFAKKDKISMHIPGHKGGRGLSAYFKKSAFSIDLTEVEGTDNLQNPNGILKTSQDNCAKIFGAGESFFLTGGSSLGLRASILGCAKRGERLIVDRTCHKSVISAIALGGVEPVFVYPEFDEKSGLYLGVSADAVARIIEENPDVCGAVITSPTYYGVCSDVSGIANVLHKNNKFLIVDEAHGAHFAFGKKNLPISALALGADICVQSAHKTLPALGQCALLHVGAKAKIDRCRLVRTLRAIQTTSPSYLLMASLDEAVRYMNTAGRIKLSGLIKEIGALKAEVIAKTDLVFADTNTLKRPQDAARIVVDFSPIDLSGKYAETLLIEEFGIYPEMSDERYVVLIPSVSNSKRDIRQLRSALCSIGTRRFKERKAGENLALPNIELECFPSAAIEAPFEEVSLEDALGRVSASVVSACPPGAAVLVPGQKIDKEALNFIEKNDIAEKIEVMK
ncbi:MAG: aminotransferase class I/II-fold pyridoxal phosphate-dependent enzyme [Clostridia bacterium]|nr:aminotransferase class I/II-fold pyridoxal phosphate-dependent enzyme [Clostridia bacterium]